MTYDDAMSRLKVAVSDAVSAAENEDGAPIAALKAMAADVDSLIDGDMTHFERLVALAYYLGINFEYTGFIKELYGHERLLKSPKGAEAAGPTE